jgi:hypothetical protein
MTEWKPEKNISSPWDADVWENNIGQPVSDTYIQPQGTLHIYSKWYDVDTTKLTSIKDVEAVFSAVGMKVSETNENFDKVKHLLIIPEQPKTLDEIKEEFDENIDELLVKTKRKFEYSKVVAEKKYKYEFDKIFERFEYAKDNGHFPLKLNFTCGIGVSGISVEPSFVIKQGNKHEGYYTFGNGRYFKYYMNKKPNFVSRFFMDKLLGFRWVDEKDT